MSNDLFFTRTSENSEEIGLSCCAVDIVPKTVFSGFILRARPIKDINSIYYAYLFRSSKYRKEIIRHSSITTRALTSGSSLTQIKVTNPHKEIQDNTSNLLSQIDNLIRSQNKKIKCNIALKNNILDTFFSKEDLKYVEMIPLKNLCTKMRSGGTPKATKSSYYNGDIPFMSISDINNNKLTNTKKNISMIGLNNSSSCIIKKNNIVYTMYATPGIAFVNYIDVAIPQSVISIELKEKDKNIFIKEYLNYVKNNVMRFAMTGTQSNLTAEIVRNIMIPKFDDNKINYICLTLSQMDNFIVVIFTTSVFHIICIL